MEMIINGNGNGNGNGNNVIRDCCCLFYSIPSYSILLSNLQVAILRYTLYMNKYHIASSENIMFIFIPIQPYPSFIHIHPSSFISFLPSFLDMSLSCPKAQDSGVGGRLQIYPNLFQCRPIQTHLPINNPIPNTHIPQP